MWPWAAPAAADDDVASQSDYTESEYSATDDASASATSSIAAQSASSAASGQQLHHDHPYGSGVKPPPLTSGGSQFVVASEYLRKADYRRMMQMESNLRKANDGRDEHNQRKAFLKEQKERFRQRGVALREERRQTEANIANSVENVRQSAEAIGDHLRRNQKTLRARRVQQDRDYEDFGRSITEKYSTRGNQETVRQRKAELADEKMTKATEMRILLKRLKKETDDDIMEVNTARVQRVYGDTAHPVIRQSKTTAVAAKWDRADNVRDHVEWCRRQRDAKTAAYIERAKIIKNQAKIDTATAAQKKHEERTAYARQQTAWRRDILEQRKVVSEGIRDANRFVRDTIDLSHLILETEVAANMRTSSTPRTSSGEEPFAMFSRFFGFSKVSRTPRPGSAPGTARPGTARL